jgi:hypothetical protein
MTHSDLKVENLKVEIQGTYILISMRGTCLRAKYRKQEAPWLAIDWYGPDDPEAPITFSEFKNLAWATANEMARRLGWVRTRDDLHQDLQRTA